MVPVAQEVPATGPLTIVVMWRTPLHVNVTRAVPIPHGNGAVFGSTPAWYTWVTSWNVCVELMVLVPSANAVAGRAKRQNTNEQRALLRNMVAVSFGSYCQSDAVTGGRGGSPNQSRKTFGTHAHGPGTNIPNTDGLLPPCTGNEPSVDYERREIEMISTGAKVGSELPLFRQQVA
jgi:hypothetical protein